MKKIYFWSILILFILALLPAGLWAQNDTQRSASDSQHEPNTHVTATHAMDVGYAFMRTGNGSRSGGTQSGNVRKQAMQLVYTGRATDTLTRATTDCYYVFALQPKGFVIVAADNRVEPILGYSYDNNFVVEDMPEHIKGWLNDYEKQIEVVIKSAHPAEADIQTKWTRLESGQPLSNTRNGNTVGPLLTTTWGQSPYYNAFCPEIGNSHAPTGCVATAMAQIINYWQYPLHGRGTHSYNSNYGTLTVNYDSTYYDYDNMPDALTSSSTLEQVNAVATLMYHCGVATNMQYGLGESGAFEVDARAAFIDFFRFSSNCSFAEKSHFSNHAWHTMLCENLDADIPVLYSGVGNSGGHSFVCDGYDNNHFFHFNFGWSGNNDGWYLTTAINPGSQLYNSSQTALVGIVPDSSGNVIIGQMQGASTFIVDEPVEFYHLLGHNAYTGTNYSNNCNNTVTFFPADTTKQLLLDILSFENQSVNIYDSIFGNQLATLSSATSNNSIVSSAHALTLLYQGSMYYSGFQLNISQDNGCRMVSNVTWSVDTNTIHLSWHENGNASQWQVEYGLKGFSHSRGTMVIANDTTIDIGGLASFKEYDMYIRSVCGQDQNGPWRMVTVMPEAKYWTDVVTSQPEGYVEDSLGNAYISTAEGLAWWAKIIQEANAVYNPNPDYFSGRKVILTADINLSRYKWRPIGFNGVLFDGQGHRIDSMYSIKHESGNVYPFFGGVYSPAMVKDIYLTNCYGGGLAMESRGVVIMNCYVSGRMERPKNLAGSVAPIAVVADASLIINCVSNCQIWGGAAYVGGIVGGVNYGGSATIRNCYSASKFQRPGNWTGYVLGYGEEVTVENCYGYISRHGSASIANGPFSTFNDNTWFDETDSGFYLVQPVFFETDSQYHRGLIDVLNEGVKKYNIDGLRIWVEDTAGINEGMPVLGPEYAVTCPNIQNLAARNVANENGEFGVELSWTERGNATIWEIEYHAEDSLDKTRVMTNNRPDTLWGLTEHATYVFRVRPICGVADYGGWSDEIKNVFDRPYWTEIVTAQPEGYSMDAEGNVTISSAEGLAWLASVVNGLNGQTANDFYEKTVTLTQDINIERYKWTAINEFLGTFNGQGHTISNLYINELANYQGLFGSVSGGKYLNIKLDNAYVKGVGFVGSLIGLAGMTSGPATHLDVLNKIIQLATIVNCHASGTVFGESNVGGLVGGAACGEINACSSSGIVHANRDVAGGLFGHANLYRFNGVNGYIHSEKSIRNCYSRCDVTAQRYTAGGLIGTTQQAIENSYAIGTVNSYRYAGGLSSKSDGSNGGEARNCYAAAEVPGAAIICFDICEYSKGSLFGGGPNATISNCYGMVGQHPLIGTSADGDPLSVTDTASVTVVNDSVVLLHSVAVGQTYYDNFLDALNAWVDTYDTTGIFLHWVADTSGVNGGFPIFEDIRYNTITISVADSTPYGTVSGAGTYTNYESTIITAIPDYGSHFIQWNDGNTDNPRTIKLTQDTAFTAIFEKDMFSIIGTTGAGISYSFDFENPARDYMWTLQNGDYVNRWCITTLDDTNRALFISNSNGYSNYYSVADHSINTAYTTIALASGQYSYSYDWHTSLYCDIIKVALIPVWEVQQLSDEWTNNNLHFDAIELGLHANEEEWTHQSGQVYVPNTGEYFFCVFWQNTRGGSATMLAPAIDNIRIYTDSDEENDRGYVLGSDTVPYLDTVVLTAIPNEYYQFVGWHDGNTDNPRTVAADADKYYIAMFDYATRTVTLHVADSTPYGIVDGGGTYSNLYAIPTASISATPDYGYHFVSWNDGNTENPRYIMLTQDTSFTAIFEKNTYFIVGTSEISIDYSFDFENSTSDRQWTLLNKNYRNRWYIATVDDTNRTLFISNNYGQSNTFNIESTSCVYAYTTLHLTAGQYNFSFDWRSNCHYWHYLRVLLVPVSFEFVDSEWSNAYSLPSNVVRLHRQSYYLNSDFAWTNTNGTLSINEGGDYKMVFQWYNTYYNNCSNLSATVDNIHFYNNVPAEENNHGYVLGSDTVQYLDSVVLTAVPYESYQFVQWHDGNTDNPRTVVADADKVLRAMFERAFVISDSIVACDSYLWHGNVYAASTMLFDTLPAAGGGDSIVAHYLMVNHPAHTAITETACESYVWTHADGTTQTCTVSDDYTYSHIDANGCTQVDTLHLTIYHGTHNVTTVTECESYTWTEGTGTTYTESGVYTNAYTNNNGYPSEDTLYLTINQSTTGEITISTCDGFDWHDSTYTESGDYVRTLSNAVGCDSVVTLHLTVNHPAHTAITETACESYVWTHADGTTQTYFVSGDYLYSHSDVNGCVQVDTLHLAIHHPSTSVDEQSACGPFTWINGETYTSSVFGPTYTLSNEAGCDSVVTLSLTMYHSDTTQFTVTACNSFVWGDSTYTETGDYAQTYEGSNGCLSVSIMHLTINYSDTTEESATACDSYLWHGNNYTESGDYTAYYTNTVGCYSMTTLHLTVNHSSVDEITATACENYEWHGIVYTESGDYDYTLTAANGCDSVVTLHLTVNEGVATEFAITTVDSCYIWNGQTYCASGDYTQNFETVDGCDSVVTLHLTITVGVDDYDYSNSLIIYPNPTKDVVNVELTINNEQLEGVGIQVFDVYGRLLEVVNMADARGASLQTTQIDLSRYANGVYFIKAVSEGKVLAIRKVVKK